MIRLWDELLDLHFTTENGLVEQGLMTENQRIITRQDGLKRLVALPAGEYPAEVTLTLGQTALDADGLCSAAWYYLANWLAWNLQANRQFRVFQAGERYEAPRVFKCYVKRLPGELAPFLTFSNAAAGAQTPLSMLAEGPALPFKGLPPDFEFDLHVVEDGVWADYVAMICGAFPGAVDKSLIFTARCNDISHKLTVNYQDAFPTADLSVQYADPGAPNSPLAVNVLTNDTHATLLRTEKLVKVWLETDGGSAIVSTAAQVLAAVEANAEAAELVTVDLYPGGDGSGVVTALAKAFITGWSGRALAGTSFWDRGY